MPIIKQSRLRVILKWQSAQTLVSDYRNFGTDVTSCFCSKSWEENHENFDVFMYAWRNERFRHELGGEPQQEFTQKEE